MAGKRSNVPRPAPETPEASQQEELHRNELLDEALEETFPASDPPAMLEPKAGRSDAPAAKRTAFQRGGSI